MHDVNIELWRQFRLVYPDYFHRKRVLEVGSQDVNGSIKQLFTECDYTGVDWRPGPNVDIVSLAHDMKFDTPFDAVVSASMLEHDPYWKQSLETMIQYIKPDGILMLSWGAALNAEHHNETAPDGKFHALPASWVVNLLDKNNMYIERFVYERQIAFEHKTPLQGFGEVGLVAFINSKNGIGVPLLSHYIEQDMVPEPE